MNDRYRIKYQKRKTIAIYITDNAEIEVRCPIGTTDNSIKAFVDRSGEWISNALERKKMLINDRQSFEITDSARLLGKIYPVKYISGQKFGFNGEYFYLPEGISGNDARERIIKVYKAIAKSYIIKKAKTIADASGYKPSGIHITSAKTRWGSCSGRNSINFSWRLIMASPAAITYVIVHELSHIAEHNHSRRFWELVECSFPEYKSAEKELKTLAALIAHENWD
ncbi:MAG: M48 family metallopeptidase [Oscillospiraceae bacterium]|nr:M48 family metallopeptidase [Oscillospiraceae bacterium]